MFSDARTIPNDQTIETDICIIGAGAAGITLARQFNGQPLRVSILESGDLKADPATQSLYAGENTGLPYFPLDSSRLRLFGGTTNHWGGTCRPFSEIDFEAREWIPHSGWPIRKSDLQPYYPQAQSICQLSSPEWDLEYWVKQDRFPPLALLGSRMGSRVAQVLPSAQRSFGKHYRDEIAQSTNVTAYLNANVTEIETNETTSIVTGVRVACLSGNKFSVKAKLFIVAVGGIENARLLLLSNSRQPAGLGNQNDLVGRFFMEHPRFEAGIFIPTNRYINPRFYEQHRVGKTTLKGYFGLSEETIRGERLVDIQVNPIPVYSDAYQASLNSTEVASLRYLVEKLSRKEAPDNLGEHLTNVLEDLTAGGRSFVPAAPFPLPKPATLSRILRSTPEERDHLLAEFLGDVPYFVNEEIFGNTPVDHIRLLTRIDPAPNPDSRVTLGAARDQLGQRRAQLDWRLSPIDKHSVRRTLEIMGMELGRAGIGRLQIGMTDDDTSWPKDTEGGWHHMGTTRMSDDPKQGVVDKNCQVHGIDNLFIAGSSVFPTAGSGTPTLTLVSLALRLADHIKERML